jgi:hypothetical protein
LATLFQQTAIHKFDNLPSSVLNPARLYIDMGSNLPLWQQKLDLTLCYQLWIHGAGWAKVVLALGHWVRRFDIDFI